jgi:hypothetical protein
MKCKKTPRLMLFLLFVFLVSSSLGFAQENNCAADRKGYALRNDALFFKGDRSDSERYQRIKKSGTDSIEKFIQTVVIRRLADGADAASLSSYLSCIQDEVVPSSSATEPRFASMHAADPATTNTPEVFAQFVSPVPIVVTALIINRGGLALPDTKPLVGCYAKSGTVWNWVGDAAKEFEGRTLFTYVLKSPVVTEKWVLLSGRHFGDTGGRLLVEVWSCDGNRWEMKWRRADLRWGNAKVNADGSLVILSYQMPQAQTLADPTNRTEVLHVTNKGLE